MKVVRDYLVTRPFAALFNGVAIGVLLPAAAAQWVWDKIGRLWTVLLIPVWLILALLARR